MQLDPLSSVSNDALTYSSKVLSVYADSELLILKNNILLFVFKVTIMAVI